MSDAGEHGDRRIALVRHARSAHAHSGWVDARGFRAWRAAYEAAGIAGDERPPAELERLTAGEVLVATSDAPRAVATARLLAPGRAPLVSPLLRELDLEGPDLGPVRLPLLAWAVAVGARNAALRLRGHARSAAESARARDAASWLEELAGSNATIVAVTHASIRRLLSGELERRGWLPEPGRRTLAPWSVHAFRRRMPGPSRSPAHDG